MEKVLVSSDFSDTIPCNHCQHRNYCIFTNASEETFRLMEESNICNLYEKGEIIFSQGNRPLGLYFIHKGKVKLSKRADGQREQIIEFAKDEDVIGYLALLNTRKYQLTATAVEDSSICFIPKEVFMYLLQKDANLNTNVIKMLCKEAEMDEDRIIYMSQKPVRERAAMALLTLKEFCGNHFIDIQLTREELASFAGTVKETMVRLLTEFKKDNIINISEDHHKIEILNEDKLKRTAGF